MPKVITGSPGWSNTVTAPADGDLANADSLEQPLRGLLNNNLWLHDAITVQGVLAIRGVSNLDDLRRLTNLNPGQVAYVWKLGVYVYLDGQLADQPPWIITPLSGATGRWLHPLAGMLSGPNAVVTTNAQNRIPAAVVPNGIVAILQGMQTGSMPANNINGMEVPGFSVKPENVLVGDKFFADWSGSLRSLQAGSWGSFTPIVTDSGQDTMLNALETRITQNGNFQNTRFTCATVWTAATTDVTFKAKIASGAGDTFLDNGLIRVLHLRP